MSKGSPYEHEQLNVDVHAYRKAIADDCVVGVCSMNNCLYPDCSPKDRKLAVPMIFDKAHGQ